MHCAQYKIFHDKNIQKKTLAETTPCSLHLPHLQAEVSLVLPWSFLTTLLPL